VFDDDAIFVFDDDAIFVFDDDAIFVFDDGFSKWYVFWSGSIIMLFSIKFTIFFLINYK